MIVRPLPSILASLPDRLGDGGGEGDERADGADVWAELRGLSPLQSELGYEFARPALLRVALTHGSWAKEHPDAGWPGNATLEYFGDAVLGLLAADAIWCRFPRLDEGRLTRLRAAVVSEPSLARAAGDVGLGRWLFLGRGQEMQGGRSHAGTLADAVEAVLGAAFMDAREASRPPLDAARAIFETLLGARVRALEPDDGVHPKARLQQWSQARFHVPPTYLRIGERPAPGAPHWIIRAELQLADGEVRLLGEGEGRNLRAAERAAAEDALARLRDRGEL